MAALVKEALELGHGVVDGIDGGADRFAICRAGLQRVDSTVDLLGALGQGGVEAVEGVELFFLDLDGCEEPGVAVAGRLDAVDERLQALDGAVGVIDPGQPPLRSSFFWTS